MLAIKDKFLGYRARKTQDLSTRQTTDYQRAQRIGVLFQVAEDDSQEDIDRFIKALKQDGKQVEAMTFFHKEQDVQEGYAYPYFTEKDISVLGAFKSEALEVFMNQSFDYLFCISRETSEAFTFIMAKSKAKCRVGKYTEGKENIFELMMHIPPNEGLSKLTSEMLNFAQSIRN